jgi:hypothetical protein
MGVGLTTPHCKKLSCYENSQEASDLTLLYEFTFLASGHFKGKLINPILSYEAQFILGRR